MLATLANLKATYRKQNPFSVRNRVFYILEEEFLDLFLKACLKAINYDNVKGEFRSGGFHPFNHEAVLSALIPTLSPPPTPPLLSSAHATWHVITPVNFKEMEREAAFLQQRLQRHQSSSPTLIVKSLSELSKGAQALAAEAALPDSKINDLCVNDTFRDRTQQIMG